MSAIIRPAYIAEHPTIVLGNNTTFDDIMENIQAIELVPGYVGEPDDALGTGLREYRLELAFDYLSKMHHCKNVNKGQIASALAAYILRFSVETVENGNIAKRLINRDAFRFDKNLKELVEKIDYYAKGFFYRYLHNLKNESSGITPIAFLSGIGMLFSGYLSFSSAKLISNEDVAAAEENAAISQISIGAALTIAPFVNAAIQTAIK